MDPLVRLSVRQNQLAAAVPIADLLVRAIDIIANLTAVGSIGARRSLGRVQALSKSLASDLEGARDLDPAFADAPSIARIADLTFGLEEVPGLAMARVRDRIGKLILVLVAALEVNIPFDLPLSLARAELDNAIIALSRAVDRATFDRRLERMRALAVDVDRALDCSRQLASLLAAELSDQLGIEHLNGLADALLAGALDDFSEADLSEVDLTDIGLLAGVRWSIWGTRWAPGFDVEALIEQSEETRPGSGTYVVTRPGEMQRVAEDVRF